jgi:predicted MFS family arabinose efflux permease
MGYGWAFGLHEGLDQLGALIGPLVVAGILGLQGDYRLALAFLALPAGVTLAILAGARILYPRPEELDSSPLDVRPAGLPRRFWLYLAAAGLVAAGFADFPLIAFRFAQSGVVAAPDVPLLYALAMGVGGGASLVFGRLFDRLGLGILVPLTVVTAAFAPLVFLGDADTVVVGVILWGIGMGVHESIIPAAVATMVPVARRASAYGLFTAGYGIAWFAGSAAMGVLYDVSFPAMIGLSIVLELAAIPLLLGVVRRPPGVARAGA